ncbi:hypothetical protein MNBD_GAMMA14-1933, partial [hydrothermal vent metagenome]
HEFAALGNLPGNAPGERMTIKYVQLKQNASMN